MEKLDYYSGADRLMNDLRIGSPRLVALVESAAEVRLEPRSTLPLSAWIGTAVVPAAGAGAGWYTQQLWPLLAAVLLWSVAAAACQWFYRVQWAKGPWLIYNRLTHRILLPRSEVEFESAEGIALQLVAGCRRGLRTEELNLVAQREVVASVRYPLLGSCENSFWLEDLTKRLSQLMSVPMQKIEEGK